MAATAARTSAAPTTAAARAGARALLGIALEHLFRGRRAEERDRGDHVLEPGEAAARRLGERARAAQPRVDAAIVPAAGPVAGIAVHADVEVVPVAAARGRLVED